MLVSLASTVSQNSPVVSCYLWEVWEWQLLSYLGSLWVDHTSSHSRQDLHCLTACTRPARGCWGHTPKQVCLTGVQVSHLMLGCTQCVLSTGTCFLVETVRFCPALSLPNPNTHAHGPLLSTQIWSSVKGSSLDTQAGLKLAILNSQNNRFPQSPGASSDTSQNGSDFRIAGI